MFGIASFVCDLVAGKRKAEAVPDKYAAPAPLPEDMPLGDQWQTSAANNLAVANTTLLQCRKDLSDTKEQKRKRLAKFDEDMEQIQRNCDEAKYACIQQKNTDIQALDKKESACTENVERATKRFKTANVNVFVAGQAKCVLDGMVDSVRVQLLPELLTGNVVNAGGEAAGAGGEAAGAEVEDGS
jgi:hypothetical protein